jgi:PLP dependent protein
MGVAENIAFFERELPDQVKLVAVSKTVPSDVMLEAYYAGQRAFGENRVQELIAKQKILPGDIEWHLIGHLQTNKVKYIVPFIHMIQSVDSLRLLSEINLEAQKINKKVSCLLQMRIAREEKKFGLTFEEVTNLLNSDEYRNFTNISINGLMGMATFTYDVQQIKKEFLLLSQYFAGIKLKWFSDSPSFSELSMGMSGDYQLALEAGTTIVRIGSLIFGDRIII